MLEFDEIVLVELDWVEVGGEGFWGCRELGGAE
jgi:hypothetical protein